MITSKIQIIWTAVGSILVYVMELKVESRRARMRMGSRIQIITLNCTSMTRKVHNLSIFLTSILIDMILRMIWL